MARSADPAAWTIAGAVPVVLRVASARMVPAEGRDALRVADGQAMPMEEVLEGADQK